MGALNDVRYAIRLLARSPTFVVAALVSLALGVGATTTTFALARGVLWKPLPYERPDRLVVVWETDARHGFTNRNEASFADFLEWRDHAESFDHLTALAYRNVNLTGVGDPERLQAAAPSVDFFDMLGVRPLWGRTFVREEEQPSAAETAILSYGLWTRRFDSDPHAIGRTISLSGIPTTIVGVLPADVRFEFPTRREIDIWVPRVVTPQARESRRSRGLYVVGRLKEDVTIGVAQSRVSAIASRLAASYPRTNNGWDVRLIPLQEQIVGDAQTPLTILFAAGVCLLLIVCANLATLLLAQSAARHGEMAIRAAVGASGSRLLRQLLIESAVLSVGGGAAGLLIGFWGIASLRGAAATLDVPRLHELHLDATVVTCALVLSAVSAVAFGLVPALHAVRGDLASMLRGAGERRGTPAAMKQTILAAGEVAIAVTLLIAAGLLVKSFTRLQRVDPGFDPRDVLTFQLSLPDTSYAEPRKIAQFFNDAMSRIRDIPGVTSAGAVTNLPLAGSNQSNSFTIEGRPPQSARLPEVDSRGATEEYFSTLRMKVVRGRPFDARDRADAPGVVVINDAMARQYWPDQDPVGRRIKFGALDGAQPWFTIVGVVADVRHSALQKDPAPEVYVPQTQNPSSFMYVAVRSRVPPETLVPAVAEAIHGLDKALPLFQVQTLTGIVDQTLSESRMSARLIGAFAFCALILAIGGTYGVVAYAMSQRRREIGVRLALGAPRGKVVRLLMIRGAVATSAGAAAGTIAALGVMRLMQSILYGVTTTDPATFTLAPLTLLGIALIACAIPAIRAARMDPAVVLRQM